MLSRVIIEQKLADLELALVRQEELMQSQRDAIRGLRDLISMEYSTNWKSPSPNAGVKRTWTEGAPLQSVAPLESLMTLATSGPSVHITPKVAVEQNIATSHDNFSAFSVEQSKKKSKPTVDDSSAKPLFVPRPQGAISASTTSASVSGNVSTANVAPKKRRALEKVCCFK